MEINGSVKNVARGVSRKCQGVHGVEQNVPPRRRHRSQRRKIMKRSKPKPKKVKKKKLTSIPVLTRRLFRLASQRCREKANFTCEICGMKKGSIHPNTGKVQRVEAHHIMSRSNKDSPLKFDLRNLVCLCTDHHKTGKYSAHKHGLWFAKKFCEIRPDDAEWILNHSDDTVNLKDRDVLKHIETCLREHKPLNFEQNKQELQEEFDI